MGVASLREPTRALLCFTSGLAVRGLAPLGFHRFLAALG